MEQITPEPTEINIETGQKLWIIKDSHIWAQDYQQALEIFSLIQQSIYDIDNQ